MELYDLMMWRMLGLLWQNADRSKPTFYVAENLGTVQAEILEGLATGRFVALFEGQKIQAAATWDMAGDEMIVTNAAANKGWMPKLVRAIRSKAEFKGVKWHRTKTGKWHSFPKQRG